MAGPSPAEKFAAEERGKPQDGIRVRFSSPEVLRAYILDPQRFTGPTTIAERMSGVREVSLGEMQLDGDLFKSAVFTLVIEPDPDPRGNRPRAIIRTDLALGENSQLRSVQLERVEEADEIEGNNGINRYFFDLKDDFNDTYGIEFAHWGPTTARIHRPLPGSQHQKEPLVVLQLFDPDLGPGNISISLFSYGRYAGDWGRRYRQIEEKIRDGLEADLAQADTWHFVRSVGVNALGEEEFKQALLLFEEAFPKIISGIYQREGVMVPSVRYEIEAPLIFEDEAETFADVGGQPHAVARFKAHVNAEKNGELASSQGRFVLLEGPNGCGKTTLAKAAAHELDAPFIPKTTLDIPRKGEVDLIELYDSWHLEAKIAAKRSGGKAVLFLEQLEAFPHNALLDDMLLNMIEKWRRDPEVFVIVSSNKPWEIDKGIADRFTEIPFTQPKRDGIREILDIHIRKIVKKFGKDLFAGVDLEKVVQRFTDEEINGRGIVKVLSGAVSLNRQGSQPITTESLLAQIPYRRLGFRTS